MASEASQSRVRAEHRFNNFCLPSASPFLVLGYTKSMFPSLRIGLVIYGSLDTLSGGYLYDRLLVHHLEAHGHRVTVLSLPWRDYPRHLADNFSTSLARRILTTPVDLWLQDELNHPSLFWLNRRARPAVPIVSIVHHLRSDERHPRPWLPLYRAVERAYLRSVDAFIFNSRTTRQRVAALREDALPPHVVAYPGGDRLHPQADAALICTRAHEPGPLRVLFLGNLIPRKGLHVLLQALARLNPAKAVLDVVGGETFAPAYARQMRRLAQRPGLQGRVRFHGRQDDEALRRLLSRAHVLTVPSRYEGFGIVYLEAMGFGLPVIAGERGAAWEFVTPGENGFLLPANETAAIAALAKHLRALHRDRERLAAMGLAARQRYEQHPTWEASMARIRGFLESLL